MKPWSQKSDLEREELRAQKERIASIERAIEAMMRAKGVSHEEAVNLLRLTDPGALTGRSATSACNERLISGIGPCLYFGL